MCSSRRAPCSTLQPLPLFPAHSHTHCPLTLGTLPLSGKRWTQLLEFLPIPSPPPLAGSLLHHLLSGTISQYPPSSLTPQTITILPLHSLLDLRMGLNPKGNWGDLLMLRKLLAWGRLAPERCPAAFLSAGCSSPWPGPTGGRVGRAASQQGIPEGNRVKVVPSPAPLLALSSPRGSRK